MAESLLKPLTNIYENRTGTKTIFTVFLSLDIVHSFSGVYFEVHPAD
jgi:hypothetical protein